MSETQTILAVDDTTESLALLGQVLTKAGYDVRLADGGELALAAARAQPLDLILLDIRMPGMDGLEVCRQLKQSDATRHIPIILMSAFAEVNDWVQGFKLGAVDYISKPFQELELLGRVRTHLALGQTTALQEAKAQLEAEVLRRGEIEVRLRQTIEAAEDSHRRMLAAFEESKRAQALQRLWADAFEHCAHGIALGDPHSSKVLACNPAFAWMLGCQPNEVVGSKIFSLYIGEDHDRLKSWIAEAGQTGRTSYESRMMRADGSTFPVQMDVISVRNEEGKVLYRVATAQDVTERKKADTILHERLELQDQFTKVAASVPGVICSYKLRANGSACMPFATSAITDLYGLGPEEVRDDFSPVFDRVHPEDKEHLQASIVESAHTMQPWHDTFRVQHPRKGERWMEGYSMPRHEADGSILWHGFVQDITERKRAEAGIIESEKRYRTLFENMNAGFVLFEVVQDDQGVPVDLIIVAANERFATTANLMIPDVIGKRLTQVFPGIRDDAADWIGVYGNIALTGESRQFEQGSELLGCYYSIAAYQAGPRQCAVTFVDITNRKRAEAEQLRLSTALEQAAESIVITDLKGTILYVNPAFERATGYSRQETLGQNPRLLKSGKQDEAYYRQMWETLTRGEVWHGHFVNRRKDGTLYEEEATISPVRDPSGKVFNYIAIKLDVTRQMQLESQFRQAQKMEAIGTLAGGVAHDFNNILAAMLMQLSLLRLDFTHDPKTTQALEDLETEAQRAASLTRQLLMFSRRTVLEVKPLDLNEVVSGLLKMLGRLIGEDVRLVFDCPSRSLPLVAADAGMIEQVLMNLVVNARDTLPKGGRITIATHVENIEEATRHAPANCRPGRYVCLAVTDSGVGMNKDTLDRIFEPFFTTKEPGKGTGLGLATVHGIIAQHKGWVEVESEPRQGTTFRVFLPAQAEAVQEGAKAMPSVALARGRETILVVEDEPSLRRTIGQALRVLGYQVYEAEDGQRAMDLWQAHGTEVDLLLTDMVMPEGTTGLELAERLQHIKPTLKVLISSGYSLEIVHAGGIKQSGIWYLPKPYEVTKLAETIRDCLKRDVGRQMH